jgi:hypothetical protein
MSARFVGTLAVAATLNFSTAQAAVSLVTSAGALGANDSIGWAQLGSSATTVVSPRNVTSGGGLSATVSSGGGVFLRLDERNGWAGNFAPGTPVLWTQGLGPDITVTFGSAVFGAGAQIQSAVLGAFTARITVFDAANNSASFTLTGDATSSADNSAIFIGVLSSMADITKVVFDLTAASSSPNDFAIGPVALKTAGTAPVPAPAALGLFGLGLLGLLAARRRAG